jgi:uncharacterized protein YkwD
MIMPQKQQFVKSLVLRNNPSKVLLGMFFLVLSLGSCGLRLTIPNPETSPLIFTQSSNLNSLEESIYRQINQHRRSKGLPPIELNTFLSQEARLHSENLMRGDANQSNTRFQAIAQQIPYQQIAVNVSTNQGYQEPATIAFQGWLNNPNNRRHLEGDFDQTGIGITKDNGGKYYITQIYLKKQGTVASSSSSVASNLSINELEQEVHRQVNQYRRSKNLPLLTLDSRITIQSRKHSEAMAKGLIPLSHEGFEQRIQAIAIPYRSVAENVAYNQGHSDPATIAVQGWIQSSGHRQNMEGDFNLTGIGIVKNSKGEYYFTQIFFKTR